jgi:hypothetical protein
MIQLLTLRICFGAVFSFLGGRERMEGDCVWGGERFGEENEG